MSPWRDDNEGKKVPNSEPKTFMVGGRIAGTTVGLFANRVYETAGESYVNIFLRVENFGDTVTLISNSTPIPRLVLQRSTESERQLDSEQAVPARRFCGATLNNP